jgi:hypothetical protein
MVRSYSAILIMFIGLLSSSSFAKSTCVNSRLGQEFVPASCDKSFKVKSVRVLKTGEWKSNSSGNETPEQCKLFQLSQKKALLWFQRSREISKHDWFEMMDWTPCRSSGTLITNGGKTYEWELDQSGRGRIFRSEKTEIYLSGSELY